MNNVEKPLSNMLPLDGYQVDSQSKGHSNTDVILNVAVSTATTIKAAVTLKTAVQEITTSITSPTTYRALSVTGNQATAVGNVVILGRDWAGRTIQETIIASGTVTVDGDKPFKEVNKITFPVLGVAGDTISVGMNDKLGFIRPLLDSDSDNFIQIERKTSGLSAYATETDPTIDTDNNTYLPASGITDGDTFKPHYFTKIW